MLVCIRHPKRDGDQCFSPEEVEEFLTIFRRKSSFLLALPTTSSTMSSLLKSSSAFLRAAKTSSHRFSTASVTTGLDREKTVEDYERVLDKFAAIRACAVLRTPTSEACPKAMQAAIDGGFKICEFTLTTPDCLQHLSNFRTKYDGYVMAMGDVTMNGWMGRSSEKIPWVISSMNGVFTLLDC